MVRILLADDHAVVRRGLRALLEARQDFEVCAEASNGREAVELALHHKPDVAVLDISLPIMNGIEATRQIRKEAPGTEVMIFTLHDRESEIRDVLHAGARGYVLKSEADEQIVRAVESLARHHAYFSDHVSASASRRWRPTARPRCASSTSTQPPSWSATRCGIGWWCRRMG